MRLLIADDHDLVRETLAAYLTAEGGFDVTLTEDLAGACQHIENDTKFDLVLLDYSMPGMDGLAGLQKALDVGFGTPVAIMSGTANKQIAGDAIAAGARGFLPKTMASKSLLNAVKFMVLGEQYIPLDFLNAQEPENDNPVAKDLTEREMQVLEGLCKGHSNKEIARDLDLQEVTIKLHVKTLCRKLNAKNRTQAAMIAKEAGVF